MDYGIESGAKPEENEEEGGVSQVQESRIGSGTMHPNAEQIGVELARMMRSPFRRMLADYLGFAPTPEALKRFADKAPDRWIQGAVMLAQLSGYQKEVHVQQDVAVNVSVMSDAQIAERLAETRAKLGGFHVKQSLPLPLHLPADKYNPVRPSNNIEDVQYQEQPAPNAPNPAPAAPNRG